jgi:hypothetical protein
MECVNYICTSVGLIFLLRMALYIVQDTHCTRLCNTIKEPSNLVWHGKHKPSHTCINMTEVTWASLYQSSPVMTLRQLYQHHDSPFFLFNLLVWGAWGFALGWKHGNSALHISSAEFFILVSLTRIFVVVVHKAPLEIS